MRVGRYPSSSLLIARNISAALECVFGHFGGGLSLELTHLRTPPVVSQTGPLLIIVLLSDAPTPIALVALQHDAQRGPSSASECLAQGARRSHQRTNCPHPPAPGPAPAGYIPQGAAAIPRRDGISPQSCSSRLVLNHYHDRPSPGSLVINTLASNGRAQPLSDPLMRSIRLQPVRNPVSWGVRGPIGWEWLIEHCGVLVSNSSEEYGRPTHAGNGSLSYATPDSGIVVSSCRQYGRSDQSPRQRCSFA